jgi:phosphodiesterase/alkaline phosphatase D-like protein
MLLVDRSNGCSPDMEAAWRSVAFGSFTRLTSLDTRGMATELAQVLAAALDLHLPTATATTTTTK